MQGQLHYTIPQHIGRITHQLKLTQVNETLDLGCGTGLTGIVLREISNHLTGVDIATKMLAHAKDKGIYDRLVTSDLTEFLAQHTQKYNLVVAADVLPYFGDLNPLVRLINQHLNPGAYFIFTTEISEISPYQLQLSARFCHHPEYINTLMQENHLHLAHQEKIPARLHNQVPLDVMLYVGLNLER